MNVPTYIKNHEAVVSFFGHWPSFHDANVLAYEFRPDSNSITLTLHTWLMTDQVDARGYFVSRNHGLVSFRFDDICAAQMDAFRAENILSTMEISPTSDPATFHVELESVMDLSGSFAACIGAVVSVVACTPKGKVAAATTDKLPKC